MLNKKKAIKVLTVTAAITGIAAVAQPINADAASSAKNAVTKAEKLAAQLKKDINYGARKKANPKTAVGLPNEKLYKQTKTAYNKALAETKKVKNTKERKVLQTRLAQKVKPFIERTDKYRAAVQTGIKLNASSKRLNERVQANNLNTTTKKQYDQVSADLKKLDKQIKSVYGATTRPALTKAYSSKAATIVSTAKFSFSFKNDTANFVQSYKNEDYAKAITYNASLKKLISDNKKHRYVSTSSKLYKKLYAAYSPTLSDFNSWGKLYIATSKSSANPTLSGGKTLEKPLSYTKDVTVVAGEDRYIKLRNANIKSNLNIIGVKKGAGTVTLENVKVSALKNKGGQIIVKDVAEKSLHLNGVIANDLVVNDANGSNIVAGAGTNISNLLVSDKAGENVNLQSSNGDAFGTIHLKSKNSKAINFAGKFDKSNVIVEGNEQKLNFAAGTVINELTLKAGANLTAAEGVEIAKINIDPAKKGEIITLSGDLKDTVIVIKDANAIIKIAENTVVGEIKVDPSVTGKVTVENKGTVTKADDSIVIIGNPPVVPPVPTPPTPPTPPVGDGGGQTPETAELIGVSAVVDGNPVLMGKDNKIDLSGQDNESKLTGVEITSKNATKFVLKTVSIRGSEVSLIGSKSLEYPLTLNKPTMIKTGDLLGIYDKGNDGISMSNLRAALTGKPIVITGYLSNDGSGNKDTAITIELGVGDNLPTNFINEYFTITKNGVDNNGKHKATVEINEKEYATTIGDLDKSAGAIKFIDLLVPYIGKEFNTDNIFINDLLVKANKEQISAVSLGMLVNTVKKVESDKYIVEFKKR